MSKFSLRFARALALALDGETSNKWEETAENLDTAADVLSEKNAQDFFGDPQIESAVKEKVVAKVFGNAGKKIENFLKLVVRRGRISEIGAIAKSFRAVANESTGVALATIESARTLDDREIREFTAALHKMIGSEIAVESRTNPALLAGVKILLGDELFDLSLAGKLAKLEHGLN